MKSKKKYKYIFLDLDDTIWDFHTNARTSLEIMYHEYDLNKLFDSFDEFFAVYAKKNIELWEAYGKGEITREFLMAERFRYPLSKMGVDDHDLARKIGDQYLDILPYQTALMPHAMEIMDYLAGKYPITMISNGFFEVQHRKIESAGIGKYFNHIVLSETAGALKPDPEIFRHALRLNKAGAHEAIMIGDNYAADIQGAINAGIDQIYYPLPHHLKENQPSTHIISNLLEIKYIL